MAKHFLKEILKKFMTLRFRNGISITKRDQKKEWRHRSLSPLMKFNIPPSTGYLGVVNFHRFSTELQLDLQIARNH